MQELPDPNRLSAFISVLLALFELGGKLSGLGAKIFRGFSSEGVYEVLDYETTLELLDSKGKKGKVNKRIRVRYLQDNNIAYQDFRWANGKIKGYKISPGWPVDEYRSGYLTYTLVSLRSIRNKGDLDEFNSEWEIVNGFMKRDGYWQTDVSNKFEKFKVSVIFPKNRPPITAFIEEKNRRVTIPLSRDSFKKLSDGRWRVAWSNPRPKLHESYILRWEW